ncbi:MAG TPA: hypothetical protein VG937_20965 [Polyangiaceae bacterium]|nr:hypothetical protein [Polyangiaceae bacterium]
MLARNSAILGILAAFSAACADAGEASVDDESTGVSIALRNEHQPRRFHSSRRHSHSHCPEAGGAGGTGSTGGSGGSPQCPNGNAWSRSYGTAAQFQRSQGIAVDTGGNTLFAGHYGANIQFGDVMLGVPSPNGGNGFTAFLVKLDPCGLVLWATGPTEGDSVAYSVASGADNRGVVGGEFMGTLAFGDTRLASLGSSTTDAFVTRFDTNGEVLWSRQFGTAAAYDIAKSVAIGVDHSVVAGVMSDEVVGIAGGNFSSFVLKYDSNGSLSWSRRLTTPSAGTISDLANVHQVRIDSANNVWVQGRFSGPSLLLDGEPVFEPVGSTDVTPFLLKFDATGALLSSRRLPANAEVSALAIDRNDQILIAGRQYTEVADPQGTIQLLVSTFLSKLAVDGTTVWSHSFGDSTFVEPTGLAAEPSGNFVLTADLFRESIDFGGGPLTNDGDGTDLVIARFDAQGRHLSSAHFGGEGTQHSSGVALDRDGVARVTGEFSPQIDFGQGPLTAASASDVFVARFAP